MLWTGSFWIAERVTKLPLGAIVDCPIAGLPVGYEWANGQTLASASTNYPDYFAVNASLGAVPDRRGRIGVGRDDMGGSAAGRVTNVGTGNSGIDGITVGAVGGAQSISIVRANFPPVDFMADGLGKVPLGSFTPGGTFDAIVARNSGGGQTITLSSGANNIYAPTSGYSVTISGHIYLNGLDATTAATPLVDMQPFQITNMIVVVE